MTSNQFHSVPIDAVQIVRDSRQRRALKNIDQLADSISRLGLIHPIVIRRDGVLIAGERRVTACKQLNWRTIPAQYIDEIDPIVLHLIELEENVKREDLTWQEQHDAMMEYYRLRREQDPTLTQEKIGADIGVDRTTITNHTLVERYRDHPLVKQADSYGTARNVAKRLHERARADEDITHTLHSNPYTTEILHGNFIEWAETYTGPKFNLIHCDFPYGIGQDNAARQGSAIPVTFDDSPEVYWNLLKALAVNLDNFCAPSAHMIFWLSANIEIVARTWEMFKLLDGFKFDEVPLIWVKSDGKGIAPDTQRRPRRVYEMAFFGWRGDRKLHRLGNNAITSNTERQFHPHEKSEDALQYFFNMCVDEHTALLDPTCGSGSALRAAKSLGAARVFGIEQNEEFAKDAQRRLADGA